MRNAQPCHRRRRLVAKVFPDCLFALHKIENGAQRSGPERARGRIACGRGREQGGTADEDLHHHRGFARGTGAAPARRPHDRSRADHGLPSCRPYGACPPGAHRERHRRRHHLRQSAAVRRKRGPRALSARPCARPGDARGRGRALSLRARRRRHVSAADGDGRRRAEARRRAGRLRPSRALCRCRDRRDQALQHRPARPRLFRREGFPAAHHHPPHGGGHGAAGRGGRRGDRARGGRARMLLAQRLSLGGRTRRRRRRAAGTR